MSRSGSSGSGNLRDIKYMFDSLREMIRELKKGQTHLRSEIQLVVRYLEENKKKREDISNQLSSAIRNAVSMSVEGLLSSMECSESECSDSLNDSVESLDSSAEDLDFSMDFLEDKSQDDEEYGRKKQFHEEEDKFDDMDDNLEEMNDNVQDEDDRSSLFSFESAISQFLTRLLGNQSKAFVQEESHPREEIFNDSEINSCTKTNFAAGRQEELTKDTSIETTTDNNSKQLEKELGCEKKTLTGLWVNHCTEKFLPRYHQNQMNENAYQNENFNKFEEKTEYGTKQNVFTNECFSNYHCLTNNFGNPFEEYLSSQNTPIVPKEFPSKTVEMSDFLGNYYPEACSSTDYHDNRKLNEIVNTVPINLLEENLQNIFDENKSPEEHPLNSSSKASATDCLENSAKMALNQGDYFENTVVLPGNERNCFENVDCSRSPEDYFDLNEENLGNLNDNNIQYKNQQVESLGNGLLPETTDFCAIQEDTPAYVNADEKCSENFDNLDIEINGSLHTSSENTSPAKDNFI